MKKIMNKKVLSIIGMAVSAIIIVMGLLAITGVLGAEPYYAGSASFGYDSGYASFGGDFYSFVNNNAAEAASGAYAAASNARELGILMKNVCGIFLMGFGLFGLCHFGMIFSDYLPDDSETREEVAEEVEFQETI